MAPSTTTDPDSELTMKLHVDATAGRVLFAAANREVVDFLHFLLESPHSPVSLDRASVRGCVGNIYDSVELLDAYEVAHRRTWTSLRPPCTCSVHRPAPAERFFVCGDDVARRPLGGAAGCGAYVTGARGAGCPSCGGPMETEVPYGSPGAGGSSASSERRERTMCLLMDDLTVKPTTASALANATAFATSILTELMEVTVRLRYTEALEILRASLKSSTVLNDVFSSAIRKGKSNSNRSCI